MHRRGVGRRGEREVPEVSKVPKVPNVSEVSEAVKRREDGVYRTKSITERTDRPCSDSTYPQKPDLLEGTLTAVDRVSGVVQGFQPEDAVTPGAREEAAVNLVEGIVAALGIQLPDQTPHVAEQPVGGRPQDQNRQPGRYVSLQERMKQRGEPERSSTR